MLATLAILLLVSAPASPNQGSPGRDSAHLALEYTLFRVEKNEAARSDVGHPVLIVTTSSYLALEDVKDGRALSLFDLSTGAGPIQLTLTDFGGGGVPTEDTAADAYRWFVLSPGSGERLDPEGAYRLSIHYDKVRSWLDAEDEEGEAVPARSGASAAVDLEVERLPLGKQVDARGALVDANTSAPKLDGSPPRRGGFLGFLDDLDLELTPQIAEDSDELALAYRAKYVIDRRRFGGGTPGHFTLDLAADGRVSTSSGDESLTGYAKADLSARAMWLLGDERYFPVGARAAVGYEGGERIDDIEPTATAQVVASVPYVGGLLETWQDALGFGRAFAPPYVSAAFVLSGAEVGDVDQDRWELEAGWIAPIGPSWDVNVRWQRFEFIERDAQAEELLSFDLTHYPGGDLTQGVRLTYESGYRAAVGDIGSSILLGYSIGL